MFSEQEIIDYYNIIIYYYLTTNITIYKYQPIYLYILLIIFKYLLNINNIMLLVN